MLYDYAMQNDIIHKNYAEFIVLPAKEGGAKERFTDLEMKKIEDAVGSIPFADCVLILCYTGFRINEFLSLVPLSYRHIDGTPVLIGGSKTKAGKDRVVPVHHKIQNLVDHWISKKGKTIICKEDGSPYNVKYFREKCFMPALEAIGVRPLTPHACRRTFSTRLSAANARKEDMIALMGHTDFEVDIDSYINQEAKTLKAAIEKLS